MYVFKKQIFLAAFCVASVIFAGCSSDEEATPSPSNMPPQQEQEEVIDPVLSLSTQSLNWSYTLCEPDPENSFLPQTVTISSETGGDLGTISYRTEYLSNLKDWLTVRVLGNDQLIIEPNQELLEGEAPASFEATIVVSAENADNEEIIRVVHQQQMGPSSSLIQIKFRVRNGSPVTGETVIWSYTYTYTVSNGPIVTGQTVNADPAPLTGIKDGDVHTIKCPREAEYDFSFRGDACTTTVNNSDFNLMKGGIYTIEVILGC